MLGSPLRERGLSFGNCGEPQRSAEVDDFSTLYKKLAQSVPAWIPRKKKGEPLPNVRTISAKRAPPKRRNSSALSNIFVTVQNVKPRQKMLFVKNEMNDDR